MHPSRLLWMVVVWGVLMVRPVGAADSPMDLAEKGFKAQTQGSAQEAMQWYNQVLPMADQLPRSVLASVRGGLCQLVFAQSVQSQSLDELNRALGACDQAILLKSDYPFWYIMRSRIRAIRGEWEQALEDISLAILLRPEDPLLSLDRARILKNLSKFPDALKNYDDFLRLSPENHVALLERGAVLLESEQPARALADFTHALSLQPKHGESLRLQAEALIALEKMPEALGALDQSIAQDPNNAAAYLQRGSLRASQHQFQLAVKDFQQAVALDANHPAMLANLGLVHFLLGHFKEAEQVFDRSATLLPNDPYAPLWRYLARRRGGVQDAVPTPQSSVDRVWPLPLFDFLQQKSTTEALLNAARRLEDKQARRVATAEALFFIAQFYLVQSDAHAAKSWLELILSTDHGEVVIRLIAEEELNRLKNPSIVKEEKSVSVPKVVVAPDKKVETKLIVTPEPLSALKRRPMLAETEGVKSEEKETKSECSAQMRMPQRPGRHFNPVQMLCD